MNGHNSLRNVDRTDLALALVASVATTAAAFGKIGLEVVKAKVDELRGPRFTAEQVVEHPQPIIE
jgi:hypothetical protein